jgi:transcriptional regulator GlxA family with amidase domain
MAGPAGVFTTANVLAEQDLYQVVATSRSVRVLASGGMELKTQKLAELDLAAHDTFLLMGGYGRSLSRAMACRTLQRSVANAAQRCERLGSVCTGAFLLAHWGHLDGYRATTHWGACEAFRTMFPKVRLQPDALYVEDRHRWTSAGVSTGIDLALAMVEQDHGSALKVRVAQQLVVYAHRPGNQSQFSAVLGAQARGTAEFNSLMDWLFANLDRPLTVSDMAEHVGTSARTFLRRFKAATGGTPADALTTLRIEHARTMLEAGMPVKRVAPDVGFKSEAAFRTVFKARVGTSPSHYARMHTVTATKG